MSAMLFIARMELLKMRAEIKAFLLQHPRMRELIKNALFAHLKCIETSKIYGRYAPLPLMMA